MFTCLHFYSIYATTNSGDKQLNLAFKQASSPHLTINHIYIFWTTYTEAIMPTDYALPYSSYFAHIKHPLKWILTYSNSCKPSQDPSALGLYTDRGDPIKKMTAPITRTNFKQQLQRQQLEQQEHLFQVQKQGQLDLPHSQGINMPRTSSPTTVPPDVPSSVLQVCRIVWFLFFCSCKLFYLSWK